MAELTLETEAKPGPPLPDGRPRQRRFAPRPNRKKKPKDHYRQTTFSGKFNKPYHAYLMGLCAHLGVDSSELIHRAAVVLSVASGYGPPPPFDLVGSATYPRRKPSVGRAADPATPELPGLTADGPPSD